MLLGVLYFKNEPTLHLMIDRMAIKRRNLKH
jgi:hypothetical protein